VNILAIALKEIQVNGSYGRTAEDFRKSLEILESDPATIRRLITHRFSLDHILDAFETMSKEKQNTMKVLVTL